MGGVRPGKQTKLGLTSITTILVGSVIGSGIFVLPGVLMGIVRSPLLVVLIFAGGGLVSLFGALTFAELGGMFPKSGGQYVYLRETVGKGWGFVYTWTQFWVIMTGVIAALSLVFAQFAMIVFDLQGTRTMLALALLCIALLTTVNFLGLRPGVVVQYIFTAAKLGAIALLVFAGFALATSDHVFLAPAVPRGFTTGGMIKAIGAAAVAGIFAYDGWHMTTYVAGVARRPQRTVPLGLGLGTAIVTGVYALVVLSFFWVLSTPEALAIGDSEGRLRIASEAARATLGSTGARLVSIGVMISVFAAVNAFILAAPRLFKATADDGLFWKAFTRTNKRFGTPTFALIAQAEWAAFLVLLSVSATDAYLILVNAVVFAIWFLHLPTVWAFFKMRIKHPERRRPYRTWGYPVVPLVFLAAGLFIVVSAVYNDVERFALEGVTSDNISSFSALWGGLLIATGLPFLFWWRRQAQRGEPSPLAAPVVSG